MEATGAGVRERCPTYDPLVGVRVELPWKRLPWWRRLLGVALTVAGLSIGAGLVMITLEEANVRDSGLLATGRVLDVHRRGKNPDMADVRFVTRDGDTVVAEIEVEDAAPFPDDGDLVDVRYLPEDPESTVVVAHVDRLSYWWNRLFWVPVLTLIAMLPAGVALGVEIGSDGRGDLSPVS